MDAPRILTLVGGISQGSLNKKLFKVLETTYGDEAELVAFDISKLPFYSQDLELEPPDIVTAFKEVIREADAVLFITPEYNHSLPGVLKNAIDWGSRPFGMNLWDNLPAGMMGASAGNIGTYGAQQHLRQVLSYLNLRVMNQPEFYLNGRTSFNSEGALDERSMGFVKKFWDSFLAWIQEQKLLAHSKEQKNKVEDPEPPTIQH